ncbi:MAG: hypothetical protein HZC38_16085 [Chloroflexi bacterium]|nr:hypothetical protein [Chloroflexota bacterium]MBI5714919.1 hypothetical protein [Chloroflexota bacterium]
MADLFGIINIWKTITEFDLASLKAEAEKEVAIAIVGDTDSTRRALVTQLQHDPQRDDVKIEGLFLDESQIAAAELIILIVDAQQNDLSREQAQTKQWLADGKNVVVLQNHPDAQCRPERFTWWSWGKAKVVQGVVTDTDCLRGEFGQALLEALPAERHLALGRFVPFFRGLLAKKLIDDTARGNASYAFSSGLAEIVPILNVPFGVADMIVLTKSQALLVYKLGLLVGYSTRWRDYLREFGSVIGGGFLWRQLATGVLGLIPIWGIIPKVAIAYAGTYVTGEMVWQWYLTGRHLTSEALKDIYQQALVRGRSFGQ